MKRLVCHRYGPPKDLVLEEAPWPEPGPGQVSVRVGATGLGFVDGLLIAGKYQIQPPLPYVPGSEFAGTVEALGAGVEGLAVGDEVYGLGQGTQALAPAGRLRPSKGLSLAQGGGRPSTTSPPFGLEDYIDLARGACWCRRWRGRRNGGDRRGQTHRAWVRGASSGQAQAARSAGARRYVPHLHSTGTI